MGVNGDGHILDAPSKDQLFDEKNQQKYRETVHIVDRNGRIMDSEKNFTSIPDFSKSLPREGLGGYVIYFQKTTSNIV